MIARRGQFDGKTRHSADRDIAEALVDWVDRWWADTANASGATIGPDVGTGGPVIGVYWPIRGEPQLAPACATWHARGWDLALPRVVAPDAPLAFGRWRANATLVADAFGTRVPDPFEPVDPVLLVAPCLGFDARGYRLGYGGGFYDRTLARLRVPVVGVCHECAQVSGFEPGSHDRPLTALITEARLREFAPRPSPGR